MDALLLQLMRMDRSIIEGLQDIVSLLEDQLKPLVQSELSLLVDILYRPELLFPPGTEARKRCESGGFIRRYSAVKLQSCHSVS
jgi:inositol 1,4,5-triphosphate receptor type 1